MTSMISLKKLKSICDFLRYGNTKETIPNTTWRKYKKKVGINSYATFTNEYETLHIMALCRHKKFHPNAEIHVDGIAKYLEDRPSERAELLYLLKAKKITTSSPLLKIIEEKTGIKISEKTLYRWASKTTYLEYKKNKEYSDTEIRVWCDYATSMKAG